MKNKVIKFNSYLVKEFSPYNALAGAELDFALDDRGISKEVLFDKISEFLKSNARMVGTKCTDRECLIANKRIKSFAVENKDSYITSYLHIEVSFDYDYKPIVCISVVMKAEREETEKEEQLKNDIEIKKKNLFLSHNKSKIKRLLQQSKDALEEVERLKSGLNG